MVTRITKLTEAQRAQMPAHRDKWIKTGLSTDPMMNGDRKDVEQAIHFWYRRAGMAAPKAVIFVPSPFTLQVATGIAGGVIYVLKQGRWPGARQDSAVDSAVRSAVLSAVDIEVDDAVDSAVRSAAESAVDSNVHFLLWSAVGAYHAEWYAGGMAWCTFFRDVCGLEIEEMDALAAIAAAAARGDGARRARPHHRGARRLARARRLPPAVSPRRHAG